MLGPMISNGSEDAGFESLDMNPSPTDIVVRGGARIPKRAVFSQI
jgi:hypothetical protein